MKGSINLDTFVFYISKHWNIWLNFTIKKGTISKQKIIVKSENKYKDGGNSE